MFENNEKVKLAFEKFRSLDTPAELWQSSVLETHGMVVMSAIDEIICNLDDRETMVEMIIEQGRSHVRFGDLTEDLFWVSKISVYFLYHYWEGGKVKVAE